MRRNPKYSNEYIGTIKITDGLIDATDPCYDKDTTIYRADNIKVCNGDYKCYAVYDRIEPNRVARCRIVLDDEETMQKVEKGTSWRRYSSNVGVDAGIAGFFVNKPDFDDEEWDDFCSNLDSNGYKLIYENIAKDSVGFCTQSGYGDGLYEVWTIRNDKRKITALEIRFF